MQACRLAALSVIVLYGCFGQTPVLRDLDGRPIQPPLEGISVFLFTRTDCPISNRYAPDVNRLHDRFSAAGVRFWLVYLDPKQDVADIRAHLREYGYSVGALLDSEHKLVRFAGATVTPEAAVYVGGRLVYRGRIDDRYLAPGKSRPAPTVRYVENVLAAAVAGKRLQPHTTAATGCFIEDLR